MSVRAEKNAGSAPERSKYRGVIASGDEETSMSQYCATHKNRRIDGNDADAFFYSHAAKKRIGEIIFSEVNAAPQLAESIDQPPVTLNRPIRILRGQRSSTDANIRLREIELAPGFASFGMREHEIAIEWRMRALIRIDRVPGE